MAPRPGDGGRSGSPVTAGQQLAPKANRPVADPGRLSQSLDWTRDLMAAAESPLVPGSKHAGGALGRRRSQRPGSQAEPAQVPHRRPHRGRLRPHHHRPDLLQPRHLAAGRDVLLPAAARRLAVAAGDVRATASLMEGGMAERDYARNVYETHPLPASRDPALLEWVDGSTFKMRVFPLEGRAGETHRPQLHAEAARRSTARRTYRFPAGHSLRAGRATGRSTPASRTAPAWPGPAPSHALKADEGRRRPACSTPTAKNVKLDRDVVAARWPTGTAGGRRAGRASRRAEHDGATLPDAALSARAAGRRPQRQRRDWVFLFESSGDRDPLLARAQIEVDPRRCWPTPSTTTPSPS